MISIYEICFRMDIFCSWQQRDGWMLFPPITSNSDQAMDVEDEEPEKEDSLEEESKFKALSCIDQVSSLA